MAEGGYDPDSTNPFDPHDDGETSDKTPLFPERTKIKQPQGIEHPPGWEPPVTKTSTSTPKSSSHHYNPSFIDETPSGRMNAREEMREEANNRTKNFFPRSNEREFFPRINDEGEVTVSLTQRKDNIQYPILDKDDNPLFDDNYKVLYKGKRVALPPKLRKALGKSVFEVREEKTEENEIEEKELREINEQIPNTVGEERERLLERRERVEERINERNQEIAAIDERISLKQKIKAIFKKYGFTAFAVATAIGTVIGVIVSNLKAGLTKVAKGVGNGLKELGKKLGQILPGMIGAIASFIFRTAGEVIGFLAKNAWLLIVGLVLLAVEQFKKKSK